MVGTWFWFIGIKRQKKKKGKGHFYMRVLRCIDCTPFLVLKTIDGV